MTPEELQARCRRFAIEIILLVRKFPKTVDGYVLGRQLCKSGTAIGANYQSFRRAKSHADFVSKIKVSEEEADESVSQSRYRQPSRLKTWNPDASREANPA